MEQLFDFLLARLLPCKILWRKGSTLGFCAQGLFVLLPLAFGELLTAGNVELSRVG